MSNYVEDLEDILEDIGEILRELADNDITILPMTIQLQAKINVLNAQYRGRRVSDIIYDPDHPTATNYDKLNIVEDLT